MSTDFCYYYREVGRTRVFNFAPFPSEEFCIRFLITILGEYGSRVPATKGPATCRNDLTQLTRVPELQAVTKILEAIRASHERVEKEKRIEGKNEPRKGGEAGGEDKRVAEAIGDFGGRIRPIVLRPLYAELCNDRLDFHRFR